MDVVVIPKNQEPYGKVIKDGNCSGFSYQTDGFVVFSQINPKLHEFTAFVLEQLGCPFEYDGHGFSIEKNDYESYAKFYMAFSILRWAKVKPDRIDMLKELYEKYSHMNLIFLCWYLLIKTGDNGYYFFMTNNTSPFSVMELKDVKSTSKNPYSSLSLSSTKGYTFCTLYKNFRTNDIEGMWQLGMSLMQETNPFQKGDKVRLKKELTNCPFEKEFVVKGVSKTRISSTNGYDYPCGVYEKV